MTHNKSDLCVLRNLLQPSFLLVLSHPLNIVPPIRMVRLVVSDIELSHGLYVSDVCSRECWRVEAAVVVQDDVHGGSAGCLTGVYSRCGWPRY